MDCDHIRSQSHHYLWRQLIRHGGAHGDRPRQADSILEDCIITGGIAPDGHISKAGGLSLKLAAASKSHIRQVLVPDEFDPAEPNWQTPFLMHVSPVDSVQQAYQTLTGNPIDSHAR